MKIGIDLGNCTSSAQVNLGNGIIFDLDKAMGVPTLFMHNGETGEDYFGEECEHQAYVLSHGEDLVRYIKSTVRKAPNNINTPGKIVSGGKSFSYRDIIKLFLEYLISRSKESARGLSGDDTIQSICITAPATSGKDMMLSSEYRNMLIDILKEITGLSENRIHVLSEPVAAAIHYFTPIAKTSTREETVLVFDLGGGTLDITIMSYDNNGGDPVYCEKRIDGDSDLGGRHWDEALAEFILKDKLGLDPVNPGFLNAVEKDAFMTAVVKAKHDLSITNRALCSFSLNDEPQSMYITLEDFERITLHLRKRTMALAKKVADSYDGTIDKIVLVGGSSNMPQIRKLVEATFPQFNTDNILLHEPSKAIAKGAAIFLGYIDAIPVPVPVKQIVERTYGWASMNSRKTPPREMIYNALMKDTRFPDDSDSVSVRTGSAFSALHDDQRRVSFVVYESSASAVDCEDGHWINFGADQNTCGIAATVSIPKDYLGRASQYLLYPKMTLSKNGVLLLEIYNEDDNPVASECNNIKK